MSGRHEPAIATLGGEPIEVCSLRGREALMEPFSIEIDATAPEGLDPGRLVGAPVVVTLRDEAGHARTVHGIAAALRHRRALSGSTLLVTVRPRIHLAELRHGSRAFLDQSAIDIALLLAREHGAPVRLDLAGAYARRPYVAKHREEDWTFLVRLLVEEGVYLWFDHGEGEETTLVLADRSPSSPALRGGADALRFVPAAGLEAAGEAVSEIASEPRVVPTRFTVRSFDPDRPRLHVEGSEGSGALEIYRARAGGPREPEVCAARARVLHEAARAAQGSVAGRSSSVRLVPGTSFRLLDHPDAAKNGEYLLTEAVYDLVQRPRPGVQAPVTPYSCRFRALRREVPYRAPERALPRKAASSPVASRLCPRAPGLEPGRVVGTPGREIHVDPTGRVRVQLAWDREGTRDDRAGKWMRVQQRWTTGSMLFPRVGWTVLTCTEEGAVSAPVVLSRIHDGEHTPSYPLPAHKTRVVFRTATTPAEGTVNEIRLEDRAGAEELLLRASRDMSVLVRAGKTERVEREATRDVGRDQVIAVAERASHDVRGDQTVSIGGAERYEAAAGGQRHVAGGETVTIAGSATLRTSADHATNVEGTRTVRVGAVLIDASLGGISATSGGTFALRASGAVVRVTPEQSLEQVGGDAVQDVGGLHLTFAGGAQERKVGKDLRELGRLMKLTCGGHYHERADVDLTIEAMGAATLDAAHLDLEATKSITITSGASSLVLTPDTVEIRAATLRLESTGTLDVTAPKIRHNG